MTKIKFITGTNQKIAQIIYNENNAEKSLKYIEKKFQEYQNNYKNYL